MLGALNSIAGWLALNYGGFMQCLKAFSSQPSLWLQPYVGIAALLLSGCSLAQGDFPSLALRDIEAQLAAQPGDSDSGADAEGADQAGAVDPISLLGPDLAIKLGAMEAEARKTHLAYESKSISVRAAVEAARGAAAGAERWSVAQTLLSDLDASRRELAVTLGDLDGLYVARLLREAEGTEPIGGAQQLLATRNRIAIWFDQQASALTNLQNRLARP